MELNHIFATHQRLSASGLQIIPLHSGNPSDFGIYFPETILSSIYQPASLQAALHYQPDSQGLASARQAIVLYYQNQNESTVLAENIIVTAGTSESFRLLCDVLAKPEENILLASPGYPLFAEIAELNHLNIRHYQLHYENNHFNFDFKQLESQIDPQTKAIVVVSPHNPSGMVISDDDWDQLVKICARKKIAIIADEVFSEFCFDAKKLPRMLSHPDLYLGFVLNGISKMFALPSFKLGWIVACGKTQLVKDHIRRLAHINDNFLSCHQAIAQGLEKLFASGSDFVKNYRTNIIANYQYLKSLLKDSPHLQLYEAYGGFYVLIKVTHPQWLDEEELVCALLTKGYFCHPGYFYDIEDGCHLVLSLLNGQETLKNFCNVLSFFLNPLPQDVTGTDRMINKSG